MHQELARLAADSPHVRGVRGVGLIWGIDVAMRAALVVDAVRDLGLLILTAGDHTIRLLPPLTITRADLARGLETLRTVLT
jgi:acetylornithine/succinyldiaminopimelate/putrescine aminotransferase